MALQMMAPQSPPCNVCIATRHSSLYNPSLDTPSAAYQPMATGLMYKTASLHTIRHLHVRDLVQSVMS